jgi:predicted RNA-binding protein with PIN domain
MVDAPVCRLDRQAAGGGAGDERVEAPTTEIDLDDVAILDALEPHRGKNSSRNAAARRAASNTSGHTDVVDDILVEAVGLPAVRWLVDGMNVIGTRPDAWWRDRHGAMVRLVGMLESWAASSGADVTVVFEQPPSPPIRSTVVEVAFAPRPRRDSADDEIVRLLAAAAEPGAIRVVTSDLWLSDRVHAAGASVEPSAPFRALIEEL